METKLQRLIIQGTSFITHTEGWTCIVREGGCQTIALIENPEQAERFARAYNSHAVLIDALKRLHAIAEKQFPVCRAEHAKELAQACAEGSKAVAAAQVQSQPAECLSCGASNGEHLAICEAS